MKVSIAMATYNGAQYIHAQLQSFIEQTRLPDELIISDDCSTDRTQAIIREFAEVAPFKVELHCNKENLGYCGNFNEALMKTNGDLVFLSDQDDVWFPEKIEHMLSIAESNPKALLLMNDAAITDSELNGFELTKIGQILSAGFSMDSFVMGCCCTIRRELLDICLPIVSGFKAHDNWIVEFAESLSVKMVDPTILQYYRRHESNESQVIVNRTTRVNRRTVFFHRVKTLFDKKESDRLQLYLKQRSIFADGITRARSKAPDEMFEQLLCLERKVREQVKTAEKRIHIREKRFISRVASILLLLKQGDYKNSSGKKSALKDIVG